MSTGMYSQLHTVPPADNAKLDGCDIANGDDSNGETDDKGGKPNTPFK
jgi:hypothetical protein